MREWRARGFGRVALGALGFGAVLGVMGPFGSQSLGPAVKYPFWMFLVLTGFAAASAAGRLVPSAPPLGRRWIRVLAVAAVSALPMAFLVAWTMGLVRPGRTFSPIQMLGLYPFVALVQLLIAGVLLWLALRAGEVAPAQTDTHAVSGLPPAFPPDFLAKLPAALRRDILALEAEDHYLRVHTRHGSALILMRLADATAMIDRRLGLRVHRSWWVARDGAVLERAAGRACARLPNGVVVPVSRTYLPAARSLLNA